MKKKIDLKQISNKVNQFVADTGTKVGEAAKETLQKSQEVGQKTSIVVQKGVSDISEKMKITGYQNRLKKYNPLFPETYFSDSFNTPNIIMIVDDAVRRGIDVCIGAIGWLGKVANTEVLYLYDEFIKDCGITFIPMPQCDSIYYVDSFDKKRFIRTDMIYSIAHEEQMGELRHIAQMLGAKKCTIEIKEIKTEFSKTDKKVSAEETKEIVGSANECYEQQYQNESLNKQNGRITTVFQGSLEPRMPSLKWFAYNGSIREMIETRLSGRNTAQIEEFEFSGISTSVLSQKAAYSIDSAVAGMGIKGNTSVTKQMQQQSERTLHFIIEF